MSFADNNRFADRPAPNIQLGGTMRIDECHYAPETRPGTRAFLSVIRSRADIGVHVFVDRPMTLGRDPACQIPLHDFGVSRHHARITPDGNGNYVLEDLRSTNGTRVNRNLVSAPHLLKDGDKIFVGDTVLRFALADEMDVDFHSEVATLVSTDPLTGLPSKRRFDQAMEFAIQDARQSGNSLALLMMDMDGVKRINDTHGHLFGAYVIGETGRLIARVIEGQGRACRFGGDEFSAFLPGLDLNAACEISEQIRSTVENAGMEKDGIPLRPTISIGVACFPDAADDLTGLVAMADKALYRAKEQGKNRVSR